MKRLFLTAAVMGALAGCAGSSSTGALPASPPPTPTVTPSPSPSFHKPLTALAIVRQLVAMNPKYDRISITYTAKNDPNHLLGRPGGYVSKTTLVDLRIPADDRTGHDNLGSVGAGVSVEYYATVSGAVTRAKYVAGFNGTILGSEYDYTDDGVVLRVSSDLTPSQATKYKRELVRIMHHAASGPYT